MVFCGLDKCLMDEAKGEIFASLVEFYSNEGRQG